MRNLFLIAALLFTYSCVFAQDAYTVSGVILNASGQVLPGASVFAQNTTIGTTSNDEGNFSLTLPAGGYDIAITYTGYATELKRVSGTAKLTIILNPKEKSLDDVVVVSTNYVANGWEKYGSFFKDNFLGQTANGYACQIANDSVLKFYFYKKSNKLKVMAEEPVLIENKALGYTISYALDSFVYEYNKELCIYSGNPLFAEKDSLTVIEANEFDRARNLAYKGSALHFMRSLYNKTLAEQGWEVQLLADVNGVEKPFPLQIIYPNLNWEKDDSTNTVDISPRYERLGILYTKSKPASAYQAKFPGEPKKFELSIFNFIEKEPLSIESNGYFYEQNNLVIGGYLGWEKVGDMLPYDFVPKNN